jgi:hypothetical protein
MIMDETMCMDDTFDVYVWMTLMRMWMDETYVYGMKCWMDEIIVYDCIYV